MQCPLNVYLSPSQKRGRAKAPIGMVVVNECVERITKRLVNGDQLQANGLRQVVSPRFEHHLAVTESGAVGHGTFKRLNVNFQRRPVSHVTSRSHHGVSHLQPKKKLRK